MMERAATGLNLHGERLNSRSLGEPADQEERLYVALRLSWSTGARRKHLQHLHLILHLCLIHRRVATHLAVQIRVQQHEGAGERVNCV